MDEPLGEAILVLAVLTLFFIGLGLAWLKFVEWGAGWLAKAWNISQTDPNDESA